MLRSVINSYNFWFLVGAEKKMTLYCLLDPKEHKNIPKDPKENLWLYWRIRWTGASWRVAVCNNSPYVSLSSTLLFGYHRMKLHGAHRRLSVPRRVNENQRREKTIQSWTAQCQAVFGRGKHDRSSRRSGLRKSLILIVHHVAYEARSYDSVGREICAKTAVGFDQTDLLSERGENLGEWLQFSSNSWTGLHLLFWLNVFRPSYLMRDRTNVQEAEVLRVN